MKKGMIAVLIAATIAVLVAGCTAPEQGGAKEKKTITWAAIDPASYGYRVVSGIVDTIKAKAPEYEYAIKPYSSTTAAIKGFCKGEADLTYAAELAFPDLYNFTGPYKGFESEVKQMPVQTLWTYTMETFILIPKEKADEIKSWSDLNGKRVYLTPAGYMNHINIKRGLSAVGAEPEHVEVDSKFVCKALEEGTIVATALYTTARTSLPTWGQELGISCKGKLVPLNPSPEEIKKIEEAGLQLVEIDAKKIDPEMEGVIYGIPFYFGYHASVKLPEQDVYRILKALEENADKLPSVDPGLKPLADDVAKFQYLGVKATNPSLVPIHPGLAKYLKEKGLWEKEWDKYIAK